MLDGTVVSEEARSILLEIPVNSELRGMRVNTLKQRIDVPGDALVDAESKELSKPRTIAALALMVERFRTVC